MRLLTYSTLYPNAAQPNHGIFVENRLRHLIAGGEVECRVVAPVPWFPSAAAGFGRYASFAAAPTWEERHGLAVAHPRYPVIPKIGMNVAPGLLYRFSRAALERQRRDGYDFQLIDAHYFYPDGVAAILLGRYFDRPVVITARGTDLSLIPDYALPRRMILWAASRAAGVVAVCQALKDRLVELGADGDRITVLRNGVDLELFRPVDRAAARQALGLTRHTLLSVGGLIPRKSNDIAIRALAGLPDVDLLLAGDGPERDALSRLAADLGVAGRVRFLGAVAHADLPGLYSAADALVLASSREGWANVLLEAMACGTPVIASDVWGTPEVVAARAAGVLMPSRTPAGLTAAFEDLFTDPPSRAETRAYAEQFDWGATTRGQLDLFGDVLNRARTSR